MKLESYCLSVANNTIIIEICEWQRDPECINIEVIYYINIGVGVMEKEGSRCINV